MKEQDPLLALTKLEEYYNPTNPHYKFTFTLKDFTIKSKEELVMKHLQQKKIVSDLLSNMKIIKNRKEKLKLLKLNVQNKLIKLMKDKRQTVSNCNDVSFNREKIQKRDTMILNDSYTKVLEEMNHLLKELKIKAEKKNL